MLGKKSSITRPVCSLLPFLGSVRDMGGESGDPWRAVEISLSNCPVLVFSKISRDGVSHCHHVRTWHNFARPGHCPLTVSIDKDVTQNHCPQLKSKTQKSYFERKCILDSEYQVFSAQWTSVFLGWTIFEALTINCLSSRISWAVRCGQYFSGKLRRNYSPHVPTRCNAGIIVNL